MEQYFKTKNGNLVSAADVVRTALISDGIVILPEDKVSISEYAFSQCKGIAYEVKDADIKYLIKHGKKVSAIKEYYNAHKELGLSGAKKIIDELAKELMANESNQ